MGVCMRDAHGRPFGTVRYDAAKQMHEWMRREWAPAPAENSAGDGPCMLQAGVQSNIAKCIAGQTTCVARVMQVEMHDVAVAAYAGANVRIGGLHA
jgi:hypothetical protein